MDKGIIETQPPAGTHALLRPAVLDRIEQVAIVVLWIMLVDRVWHSSNPFAMLMLLSETAVVLFVLIRRSTEAISVNLGDWLLAITATAAPLLIIPSADTLPALVPVGVALVLIGNIGQAAAKLILRRSFGIAPANRGLKLNGPYRLVRHPMYAGYLLVHVGLLMLMPTLLNLVIYVIGWWAQILRLLAEERLLMQDEAYRDYAGQVRYRLVPGLF
jgi:protein-S-isoprenylcysteine O-methyltransferase Ste14